MRWLFGIVALTFVFSSACKKDTPTPPPPEERIATPKAKPSTSQEKPAAAPAKWPTPARSDGKAFAPLESVATLDVGAKIELWWRATRSTNPFEDHGPYTRAAAVTAKKAPWGDEGGLSGASIMSALREAVGSKPINEARLRGISAGVAGPDFKRAMITVDDSASSFFNKTVGRSAAGIYQIFVDVDFKGK